MSGGNLLSRFFKHCGRKIGTPKIAIRSGETDSQVTGSSPQVEDSQSGFDTRQVHNLLENGLVAGKWEFVGRDREVVRFGPIVKFGAGEGVVCNHKISCVIVQHFILHQPSIGTSHSVHNWLLYFDHTNKGV